MGYTKNRFMIIHSWDAKCVQAARLTVLSIFAEAPSLVGPVMDGVVNTETGFVIWTSGSKLGWPDADQHDQRLLAARESAEGAGCRWAVLSQGEVSGDIEASAGWADGCVVTARPSSMDRARP